MIAKLRRKLTLLVIAVLVIVTAGIIFAINFDTYRSIDRQAYAALRVLSRNRGTRPGALRRAPEATSQPEAASQPEAVPQPEAAPQPEAVPQPEDPDASSANEPPAPAQDDSRPFRQFERLSEPEDFAGLASLSNSYTIVLGEDGQVASWSSDRADLYDDDQVAAMAATVLAAGRESGRVGTQYYLLSEGDGDRRLVVLDARLEHMAARRVLRTSALVAGLACAILSLGAWLLIRRMVLPVQAAFERQKQFVWDASYEFKTPLAVISANAEVLASEIGENEVLGYIQSEVRRTDRLVQSLLTLARMDKGTVTANIARFDLSKALLGVALPFESTVFEAGRTLETDVPDGVFIRGDAEMLQQLAVILLSNALKYSNAGGVIRLTLRQKGRGCQFSVYNTGMGIAPEHLEKIFDRFYREDLSHNSEIAGNGLGLAIARNIVEAHKGRIHAESTPGESATFIVTIP